MTETAKSKIKNFKNQITEKFNVGEANGFRTYIGKLSPVNVLDMLDDIERSITTDKLSVEKLIEKEIKDYEESYKISGRRSENYIAGILQGLKIARAHVIDSSTTDEKTVKKLQEQLNTAKKALTESEEKYQKQMDRFLNSEMNESARSHCESQLKLLFPAHKAYEALAAIGGKNDGIRI